MLNCRMLVSVGIPIACLITLPSHYGGILIISSSSLALVIIKTGLIIGFLQIIGLTVFIARL